MKTVSCESPPVVWAGETLYLLQILQALTIKLWVSNTAVSPPLVFLHFLIHFYSHLFSGHLTVCIFECLSWHLVGLYHLCRLLLIHLLFLLKCIVDSFKNNLEHYQKNRCRCSEVFFLQLFQRFSTGLISKYLCAVGSWAELDRMSCWTFVSCWTFCILLTAGYCLVLFWFSFIYLFIFHKTGVSLPPRNCFFQPVIILQLFFHYSFTLHSWIAISCFKWVQPFNLCPKMSGYFYFHLHA